MHFTVTLFEELLSTGEGLRVDYKRQQYKIFDLAAGDEKEKEKEEAEILKDLLGFANAKRDGDSFILIGVDEVNGLGRAIGIDSNSHLPDHTLQQFVRSKLNKKLHFSYFAFGYHGKHIGVIHIPLQDIGFYLKSKHSFLPNNQIFVRLGSSTDWKRPATPEEIMEMGATRQRWMTDLRIQFAEEDETTIGSEWIFSTVDCDMPSSSQFGMASTLTKSGFENNSNFLNQLSKYVHALLLTKPARFSVTNISSEPANDVHVEITVSDSAAVLIPESFMKDIPQKVDYPSLAYKRPTVYRTGDVSIKQHRDGAKLICTFDKVQPHRTIFSRPVYFGRKESGSIHLNGKVFAANMARPSEFQLSINATVEKRSMTLNELIEFGNA